MKFETPIMNITGYGRENVVTVSADPKTIKKLVENGSIMLDGQRGSTLEGSIVTAIF